MHEASSNGTRKLSPGQKVMQARDLVAAGWPVARALSLTGANLKAYTRVRGTLDRKPELAEALRDGSMSVNAAAAEAGYVTNRREIALGASFGKGDKWIEATEPLMRYLDSWQTRGFEFRHVNPTEANKRLRRIELLIERLGGVRDDLEKRAHKATLSVRSH